ncbi:hypothetical protein AALP_AA8G245600 [Arabis alpina]|uniref:Uncharacterized protein n=1 Tax=Arabis alpina TaxID=50452 RepID=A0A087G963_ARAAL|nr:hypothetical protein AALP_AA8G245600 [Arabis alpina]
MIESRKDEYPPYNYMFFKRNRDLRYVSLPSNKMSLNKHENIIFDLSDDECVQEEDDEGDDEDDDGEEENEIKQERDDVQEEDEDDDFDEMMLDQQVNHPSNNTPFPNVRLAPYDFKSINAHERKYNQEFKRIRRLGLWCVKWVGKFNRRFKKIQGKDYVSDEATPTPPDETDSSMLAMVGHSFYDDNRHIVEVMEELAQVQPVIAHPPFQIVVKPSTPPNHCPIHTTL